ncbi:DUF2889 domain-containing protein [Motiliproteus sp. SC1-56]|uniref:DUF2889 domain-containing protein n=1 Tax=Motiliproteus sp. SC1-56 TaxID=2799565 RepID=UPI001A8DB401|nr:DUF2889 domain-containing protein [Motiliproteus sp. SC1-56]
MPLPPPAPRRKAHRREVTCEGFERDDGLWDIEGRMTDVKTYAIENRDRGGLIPAGEPLHDMALRLTISLDGTIHQVEAVIDHAPFSICPRITGAFKQLEGQRIGPGWNRLVRRLFAGTQGCTHLMELLGPIATTAFQATSSARKAKAAAEDNGREPGIINSCHALAADGEVVRDFWPAHYHPKE